MTELTIAVPPALKTWVDEQVAEGEYADAADVVRSLIRRARYAKDVERVQKMIDEGFASGIVDAEPEDVLREIMARIPE